MESHERWRPFRDGFRIGYWNPFLIGMTVASLMISILCFFAK